MKLTRILYLSDYEVIAYQANAKLKTLEIVQRFAKNTEGYDDFKHYLQQDVKTPIFWLVDTSYEEYRIAQIPHVLGKDRKSVLAHRMKRLFEYTSYTYAQVQGRETSGRGDDIVLFTALNQINLLQPWLNDILEYKIPLRGIYSVPLLSQSLLRYFSPEPYTLLVTHTPKINAQSTHGLRQSFFVQQSFQLSRLIPVTLEYSQAYAKMIIDQIIKTQYYLNSTRLLPSTTPLSVFILLPPPLLHVVHDFVNKYPHPDLYIHCIDIHELAQQFDFQSENQLLYLHDLVAYHLVHITPNNH